MFTDGPINGLIIKPLKFYEDSRGWLTEIFREDDIPAEIMPVMSYISLTNPRTSRGPHEHTGQTDYFAFLGPADFLFMAWDNRTDSATYNNRVCVTVGAKKKCTIIIPPGIVHGYSNIGDQNAMVFNYPNRLFAGKDKKEKVDEIRHEDNARSPFVIDFLSCIERKVANART